MLGFFGKLTHLLLGIELILALKSAWLITSLNVITKEIKCIVSFFAKNRLDFVQIRLEFHFKIKER